MNPVARLGYYCGNEGGGWPGIALELKPLDSTNTSWKGQPGLQLKPDLAAASSFHVSWFLLTQTFLHSSKWDAKNGAQNEPLE